MPPRPRPGAERARSDGPGNSSQEGDWQVMAAPSLALVVLRCKDLEASKNSYASLGMRLCEEKHGNGPKHYACDLGGLVLELYPGQSGTAPDPKTAGATMHGFRVRSLDDALTALGR